MSENRGEAPATIPAHNIINANNLRILLIFLFMHATHISAHATNLVIIANIREYFIKYSRASLH